MLIGTLLSTYCLTFVGINGYCLKPLSVTYLSIIEEKCLLKNSAIILKSVTSLSSWTILLIDLSDVCLMPNSLNKETNLRGSSLHDA